MEDLTLALQRANRLQKILDKKKATFLRLQAMLDEAQKEIMRIYTAPYLQAFEHYNETAYYRVNINETNFIVDEDKLRINVYMKLLLGSGLPPIDKMKPKDVREIHSKLSPLIKQELSTYGQSLPFGSICVPNDYYK